MGIIRFMSIRLVEVIVVLMLILFMPNIPPNVNFTYFKVPSPQKLEGNFAINNRLNGVEHLYQDQLKGPEAFAEYNGELYTSLHGGDIVKFSKGHIVPVAKFGKPCSGFIEESICGRPLAIEFDKNGFLYAADAYMGIWKVDIKTGHKTLLVSMDVEIENKKPKLPNSLAICKNGDIYWTDSSTDFSLEDGAYAMLADGTGRVIHYDAKTKTNKVLMDGLQFANGIILSDDEEFILIAETGRSRLYRFWLKGPKKGTHDIFAESLPGSPDNLNSDGKGGFFVPLFVVIDAENPSLPQILGPFPWIRKLFARIIGLVELGFKTVDRIYPNVYAQTAVHWIGHFESLSMILPERVSILHYSKSGEMIESFHNVDKTISTVSEAFIFGDHLYLGSPMNNYVGRVPLKQVGLEPLRKKRDVPMQEQPPKKQEPTTTTPKPTTKAPPPTAAPKKQSPPPTAAPTKQTPPPTAAPTKQTPPTAAPKQTPPPTVAPVKQSPPPTAAPVKQSPPPPAAPVKQSPPPTKQAPPPTKQAPPPTAAPVKQAPPPTPAPAKQAPPPVQQAPPPAKQAPPPTQQAPPPAKQAPPPTQQAPPPAKPAEANKVKAPVKNDNPVPKSQSGNK